MNAAEAKRLLLKAKLIWSSVPATNDAAELWAESLIDIPYDYAYKALVQYIRGIEPDSDWPPKPSDILRIIARDVLALPTEDDAWRMVEAEIDRVGRPRIYADSDGSDEMRPTFTVIEVAMAVEAVGYLQLLDGEGTYPQHAFREAYRRYVEQTRKRALMAPGMDIGSYRIDQASSLREVSMASTVVAISDRVS